MSVDGETLLAASARLSEHADTLARAAERYGSATVEVQRIGRSVEQHWSGTVLSERSADRIEALAATLDRIAPVIDLGGSAGIVQRLGDTAASLGRAIAHLDAECEALVRELWIAGERLPDAEAQISIDQNRQTRSQRADDWLDACALAGRNVAAAANELEYLFPDFERLAERVVETVEAGPVAVRLEDVVETVEAGARVGEGLRIFTERYMKSRNALNAKWNSLDAHMGADGPLRTGRIGSPGVQRLVSVAKIVGKISLPAATVVGVLTFSDNLDTARDPEEEDLDRIAAGFEMGATVLNYAAVAMLATGVGAPVAGILVGFGILFNAAAMGIHHRETLREWADIMWLPIG